MKDNHCLGGVDCAVHNCHFNTVSGKCTAQHIKVDNEKASSKSETFCSTFKPKCC